MANPGFAAATALDTEFTRGLGLYDSTMVVVGSMIGSGIFMLPVSLAPLGANAVLGWLISIVGALTIAFALASLGRTGAGGIHTYIGRAFGPTAAFLVTWAFWWSNIAAQAALAIATASASWQASWGVEQSPLPSVATCRSAPLAAAGSASMAPMSGAKAARTMEGEKFTWKSW